MQLRSLMVWVTAFALLVATTPALAQQHVVTSSGLQQAVDQHIAAERASREFISRTLTRAEVQQAADTLGLDLKRAHQAVAQLSGSDLIDLAAAAQAVDADLAGGAQTVTISVTTLLIVLLVVLLIAND